MKFRQALTLYFLLYIALYSVAFAQPVHIPDHALRTQIEIALELAPGTRITRTDMSHLDALDLQSQGITSLNGLEFATELTFLVIADNPTIDLTPVSELTQLQRLGIWSVPHLDITPLARLTNLHALSLTACEITDITPLTPLTELIDLDLRYNSIRDINSISNLRQLQKLDLSSNRITDVSSLAQLTNLTFLAIQNNQILDHAPINALSLSHFTYDQACETPPTPLMPRLENRQYPSVFAPSWLIHPTYSGHDLFYGGSYNGLRMQKRKHGWALVGDLPYAKQLHADIITTTPSMVFLINIAMREEEIKNLGEDWPYWVRNNQGQILRGYRDDYGLVNFTHPHVQDRIVDQVIAVSKCGLFDGIVFDWWRDANDPILPDYLVGAAAEFDARLNILQRIRAQTRPDFLIQVNSNWRKLPRTGPYINGLSMETGIPNWFLNGHTERDHTLNETENTLQWAEHNLRTPRINGVAGEAILHEPADSPENRRWMRFITTLSLTLSDGYVIYQRARNDWWISGMRTWGNR